MNRFFRSSPETYEAIRAAMDAASGFPSAQASSWFATAADAPKDADGLCLIAAIAPIADQFAAAGAEELTADQYSAALPPPALSPL